jgi:hypothetical protein
MASGTVHIRQFRPVGRASLPAILLLVDSCRWLATMAGRDARPTGLDGRRLRADGGRDVKRFGKLDVMYNNAGIS